MIPFGENGGLIERVDKHPKFQRIILDLTNKREDEPWFQEIFDGFPKWDDEDRLD